MTGNSDITRLGKVADNPPRTPSFTLHNPVLWPMRATCPGFRLTTKRNKVSKHNAFVKILVHATFAGAQEDTIAEICDPAYTHVIPTPNVSPSTSHLQFIKP